jgi:hypothetical protein
MSWIGWAPYWLRFYSAAALALAANTIYVVWLWRGSAGGAAKAESLATTSNG